MKIEIEPYTKIPNQFIDLMPDMGKAEFKVMVAIYRLTLGYHKSRARASITTLHKMTGLARQSILDGTKQAEERGLIEAVKGKGVTSWVVRVVDRSSVRVGYQNGKGSRPPSIKEKLKDNTNIKDKYTKGEFSDSVIH